MSLADFNVHHLTKLNETLLDGEPVFVIRAQDKASIDAIHRYIEISRQQGGNNIIRCSAKLQEFIRWQQNNPDKVRPAT